MPNTDGEKRQLFRRRKDSRVGLFLRHRAAEKKAAKEARSQKASLAALRLAHRVKTTQDRLKSTVQKSPWRRSVDGKREGPVLTPDEIRACEEAFSKEVLLQAMQKSRKGDDDEGTDLPSHGLLQSPNAALEGMAALQRALHSIGVLVDEPALLEILKSPKKREATPPKPHEVAKRIRSGGGDKGRMQRQARATTPPPTPPPTIPRRISFSAFLDIVLACKHRSAAPQQQDHELIEAFRGLGGDPRNLLEGGFQARQLHAFVKELGLKFDEEATVDDFGDIVGCNYEECVEASPPHSPALAPSPRKRSPTGGLGTRPAGILRSPLVTSTPVVGGGEEKREHLRKLKVRMRWRSVVNMIISACRLRNSIVPWFLSPFELRRLNQLTEPQRWKKRKEFIPASSWEGRRVGYFFGLGCFGQGYYLLEGDLPGVHLDQVDISSRGSTLYELAEDSELPNPKPSERLHTRMQHGRRLLQAVILSSRKKGGGGNTTSPSESLPETPTPEQAQTYPLRTLPSFHRHSTQTCTVASACVVLITAAVSGLGSCIPSLSRAVCTSTAVIRLLGRSAGDRFPSKRSNQTGQSARSLRISAASSSVSSRGSLSGSDDGESPQDSPMGEQASDAVACDEVLLDEPVQEATAPPPSFEPQWVTALRVPSSSTAGGSRLFSPVLRKEMQGSPLSPEPAFESQPTIIIPRSETDTSVFADAMPSPTSPFPVRTRLPSMARDIYHEMARASLAGESRHRLESVSVGDKWLWKGPSLLVREAKEVVSLAEEIEERALHAERRVSHALRKAVFVIMATAKADRMSARWRRDCARVADMGPEEMEELIQARLNEPSWIQWKQRCMMSEEGSAPSRTYSEMLRELDDQLPPSEHDGYMSDPDIAQKLRMLEGIRSGDEEVPDRNLNVERISELSDMQGNTAKVIGFEEFAGFFDRYRVYKGYSNVGAFKLHARRPGKEGKGDVRVKEKLMGSLVEPRTASPKALASAEAATRKAQDGDALQLSGHGEGKNPAERVHSPRPPSSPVKLGGGGTEAERFTEEEMAEVVKPPKAGVQNKPPRRKCPGRRCVGRHVPCVKPWKGQAEGGFPTPSPPPPASPPPATRTPEPTIPILSSSPAYQEYHGQLVAQDVYYDMGEKVPLRPMTPHAPPTPRPPPAPQTSKFPRFRTEPLPDSLVTIKETVPKGASLAKHFQSTYLQAVLSRTKRLQYVERLDRIYTAQARKAAADECYLSSIVA